MFRLFGILICLLAGVSLRAQTADSLFVEQEGAGGAVWHISHTVQSGETIFTIARRYHVPPAMLAQANGVSYQDGLQPGRSISVPVAAYNLRQFKPTNMQEARPLYYRVQPGDQLGDIGRDAGVSQRILQDWNKLSSQQIRQGQALLVGWILYDNTRTTAAPNQPAQPPRSPDTPVAHTQRPAQTDTLLILNPTPAEEYAQQTVNGNVVTERGTAQFFKMAGSASASKLYAFHNGAAKGTIIRVQNLNNGRIIYATVIGPIPANQLYAQAAICLSNAAKARLGSRDNKMWCELSYAGY